MLQHNNLSEPWSGRGAVLAVLDSLADFGHTYLYDNLSRLISLSQQATPGGNAVADKRVVPGESGRHPEFGKGVTLKPGPFP